MFSTSSKTSFIQIFALLLMVMAVGFGCQDDEAKDGTIYLNYDGDNDTSPALIPGTFEAAARFPAATMVDYVGYDLTEVEFYINEFPDNCEVFIRSSNGSDTPGPVLHSSGNIISEIRTQSWNTYVLPESLILDGQGIWIGVRFRQDQGERIIGCDEGEPAHPNGAWLYDSNDEGWIPFYSRTAANGFPIDINWNIRGVVEINE